MAMTSNELEQFKQSILDEVRVMMQTTGQVTQYIGARYVPLFAEPFEWSDQKEYEPLTIVTHQGNSFTSRQFVPKGIGIDNAEFWASTGNYNAQIEQYRKEVEQVKKDIDAITFSYENENELKTAKLKLGEIIYIKSRDAFFQIVEGQTANGIDILDAGNYQCSLIYNRVINLKSLGGGGSSNNAEILNRAFNLLTSGMTLDLNAIEIELDHQFTIPTKTNITVQNGSFKCTRGFTDESLVAVSPYTDSINDETYGAGLSYSVFNDVRFDSNGTDAYCFNLKTALAVTMNSCYFLNSNTRCLNIDYGAHDNVINSPYIRNLYRNKHYNGVGIYNSGNDCEINGGVIVSHGGGIYLGSNANIVRGVHIYGAINYNIYVAGSFIDISDVYLDGSTLVIENPSNLKISGIMLKGDNDPEPVFLHIKNRVNNYIYNLDINCRVLNTLPTAKAIKWDKENKNTLTNNVNISIIGSGIDDYKSSDVQQKVIFKTPEKMINVTNKAITNSTYTINENYPDRIAFTGTSDNFLLIPIEYFSEYPQIELPCKFYTTNNNNDTVKLYSYTGEYDNLNYERDLNIYTGNFIKVDKTKKYAIAVFARNGVVQLA